MIGWTKSNSDGAVDVAAGRKTGVMARDQMGMFASVSFLKKPRVVHPYTIELLAVRDTVLLAVDKAWQNVVLETDYKTLL